MQDPQAKFVVSPGLAVRPTSKLMGGNPASGDSNTFINIRHHHYYCHYHCWTSSRYEIAPLQRPPKPSGMPPIAESI
jgi:hypothetical protein